MPAYSRILLPWDRQPPAFIEPAQNFSVPLTFLENGQALGVNRITGARPNGFGAAGDAVQESGTQGLAITASTTQGHYFDGVKLGTEYTLVALVTYFTSGSSIQTLLDSDSSTTAQRSMFLRVQATTFTPELLVFNTSSSTFSAVSSVGLQTNAPSIVVGRVSGNQLTVWINGVQTGSATLTGTVRTLADKRLWVANTGRTQNTPFRNRLYVSAAFDGALRDDEIAALKLPADVWRAFYEPQGIWVPVPVAGGATNYPVTATEAASAADSCSAIVGYATTATETGSAADTLSAVTAKSGTVTEPATAVDTVTSSAAVAVSITETASAADAVNATAAGDYAGTVTEAASAADTASAVAAFLASLTEPATAADTVSGAGAGAYTGTIDEAAAATDLASAVYAYLAGVSEVASAADLQSALAALSVSITEAATATDTVSVAGNAEPLTNAEMQQLYVWMQQLVNERHLTLPQFLALK